MHRKVIRGELWEKEAHVLPACVDCHQPHKVRKVFYDAGHGGRATACTCHERPGLKAPEDGRSLFVDAAELAGLAPREGGLRAVPLRRRTPRAERPCETITHEGRLRRLPRRGRPAVPAQHARQARRRRRPERARAATSATGRTAILGKSIRSSSPTFADERPEPVRALPPRGPEGGACATRAPQHEIIENYTESIHGKGLLKSGLVVTATCTELPHRARRAARAATRASSVNRANVAATCGQCHHGIEEQFEQSIHSPMLGEDATRSCRSATTATPRTRSGAPTPTASSSTSCRQCGRCHEEIAKTYFDTYHGKVVAARLHRRRRKCYDCHGAHDILPVDRPALAPLAAERGRDLPEVPSRARIAPLRRLPDATRRTTTRRSTRSLFWTFWGDDGAAGRHLRRRRRPHAALAAAASLGELRRESRAGMRSRGGDGRPRARDERQYAALHARLQPRTLHIVDDRQLHQPRPDRHDAQVLLHRLGRGRSRACSAASRPPASSTAPRAVIMFGLFVTHLVRRDPPRSARARRSWTELAPRARLDDVQPAATCGSSSGTHQVVRRHGAAARRTAAGPTGRSSTTSPSSGASS